MKNLIRVLAVVSCLSPLALQAGSQDFKPGKLVSGHGLIAPVPEAVPIPDGASFKVAFDLAKFAGEGSVNRQINSAARFLNMHHAAGVPAENLQLALIVHGGAHRDFLTVEAQFPWGSLSADKSPDAVGGGVDRRASSPDVKVVVHYPTASPVMLTRRRLAGLR